MAKGDNERVRNEIDYQRDFNTNMADNLREKFVGQNAGFTDRYNNAANIQTQDYGNIMGEYDNFSKTGGYSPEDIANFRARATSPIRAAYANAMRENERAN